MRFHLMKGRRKHSPCNSNKYSRSLGRFGVTWCYIVFYRTEEKFSFRCYQMTKRCSLFVKLRAWHYGFNFYFRST